MFGRGAAGGNVATEMLAADCRKLRQLRRDMRAQERIISAACGMEAVSKTSGDCHKRKLLFDTARPPRRVGLRSGVSSSEKLLRHPAEARVQISSTRMSQTFADTMIHGVH
jgi:hypothetical protein